MKCTHGSKHFTLWLILFYLLVVSVNTFAGNADVTLTNMSVEQFTAHLDSVVPGILKSDHVEGMVVAAVQDGEIAFMRAYGLQDKEQKIPMDVNTVFQMASISKSFAALGVMKLVEEGKIDLDAPVETYLTRWKLPPSKFNHADVTVRRLLSHTAGISLSGYPGENPKKASPTLEQSLNGKTGGVGKVYVQYEPGMQFAYSGGGYSILQLLIEEVTGQRFEDYMAEQILHPLGMTSSSFTWDEHLRSRTAKGYDAWGSALPNYLFTAKAAAGLYSTAPDLIKWMTAIIEICNSTESTKGMIQRKTADIMFTPIQQRYALGHFSSPTRSGEWMIWHSGANAGWRCIYVILPGLRDGIVILTNNDQGTKAMYEVLNQWFAWENVNQTFRYAENFMTKAGYFYNVLRNFVE